MRWPCKQNGVVDQAQAQEAVVLPGAASGRRVTSDADGQLTIDKTENNANYALS